MYLDVGVQDLGDSKDLSFYDVADGGEELIEAVPLYR